jgi:hypothetical protein
MAGDPGFGESLGRLAERRGLGVGDLCQVAGVAEDELRAEDALRRVASVLGLHAADLFAIAAVPVPDDLAPLDPDAGRQVRDLAGQAAALSPEKVGELRQLVASLPRERRTKPRRSLTAHRHYATHRGPGAILMRMLENRNLGWMDIAVMFAEVGNHYLSAATYGQIGVGRQPLTPALLMDFTYLLDVPVDDLTALTGITPAKGSRPPRARVAELIWDVRRLTAEQVEQVLAVATDGVG